MIQKIKNALKKRKAKLFFLFLLCSGLAWFVSNLSHRYSSNTSFALEYVNFPDSLMLMKTSKQNIDVKLEAGGFQLMAFNLGRKKIKIDLSRVQQNTDRFFIGPNECKRQIEKQLPKGVTLKETDGDSLFFGFYNVISKMVPVRSTVVLDFEQNYLLDGQLAIEPDSLLIKGPRNEVDTIRAVRTMPLTLNGLTDDFAIKVALDRAPKLLNTTYSATSVMVKGKILRFSEKVIKVKILVLNLPEGTMAQIFPDEVQILVKADMGTLKDLKSSDFSVSADYAALKDSNSKSLPLRLVKSPNNVYSLDLLEDHVDFILKRE